MDGIDALIVLVLLGVTVWEIRQKHLSKWFYLLAPFVPLGFVVAGVASHRCPKCRSPVAKEEAATGFCPRCACCSRCRAPLSRLELAKDHCPRCDAQAVPAAP